jgi:hypothetical protein
LKNLKLAIPGFIEGFESLRAQRAESFAFSHIIEYNDVLFKTVTGRKDIGQYES